MRNRLLISIFFIPLFSNMTFGQKIISGLYESGLQLAIDKNSGVITGYFNNQTGWNDESKKPDFSCIFYLEGHQDGNIFRIQTYYPLHQTAEPIRGIAKMIDENTVKIKLEEEHGGCWNVWQFSGDEGQFDLVNKQKWIQIRYVTSERTYFHTRNKEISKRANAYLVKGDVVSIHRIEGEWAYCTYLGRVITRGWIRQSDLNALQ